MSLDVPAFRLEGLAKRFGGKPALHPTTLSIEAGRTLALIGPSGCGKSTLLRLLMGLIAPDSGVAYFGPSVIRAGMHRELRRRVGYVIQEGALFPPLPGARNVALAARDLGWTRARIELRLGELASLVGLPTELLERYPAQLSGGQRQRVGLMRALMLDPEAVLMDEPLAALDPMIRSRLQEDLRRIFRVLQKTVVLVTHDLAEAAYLGDRIALMRGGQLIQLGSFADLRDRPAETFVSDFVRAQRAMAASEVDA